MDELGLFTAALGLSGPWRVARTEFDAEQARLDLYLEFGRGVRFPCPATDCAHGNLDEHAAALKQLSGTLLSTTDVNPDYEEVQDRAHPA